MSAIGPGDFVECVDASPRHGRPSRLVVGAVYQVLDTLQTRSGHGLTLVGLVPSPQIGWYADRFRPIYRRKQSLITDLLTKAPSELEPA